MKTVSFSKIFVNHMGAIRYFLSYYNSWAYKKFLDRLDVVNVVITLIPLPDFVGYLLFSKYRLVRTRAKHRMKKRLKKAYVEYLNGKIEADSMDQRLQSYLGILSHTHQATLSQALKNAFWVRTK